MEERLKFLFFLFQNDVFVCQQRDQQSGQKESMEKGQNQHFDAGQPEPCLESDHLSQHIESSHRRPTDDRQN